MRTAGCGRHATEPRVGTTLIHGIRWRLLGLLLATVVPFTALIAFAFYTQLQNDRAAAIQRALTEARLLAAQVDDHVGDLMYLLDGVGHAVSTDPADTAANDELLRQV